MSPTSDARAPTNGAPQAAQAPATTRVVLATSDPVFAALGQRALDGTALQLVAAVAPSALLETTRQLVPDLLVLDADGEDAAAVKALATKVMLVSDARLVLVSAYLAPGSPGLGALLQTIAATFVQKPQGPSSLGLADSDGPPFVAALQAAFAAHDGVDLDDLDGPGATALDAPLGGAVSVPFAEAKARAAELLPHDDDIDAAWDVEDEPRGGR